MKTAVPKHLNNPANAKYSFLAKTRLSKEIKGWRARRAQELREYHIQQKRQKAETAQFLKTYFKAWETILETNKIIAENYAKINLGHFTEALYTDKELVQAKYIIEDENLPFEVRDGKIHYTGRKVP